MTTTDHLASPDLTDTPNPAPPCVGCAGLPPMTPEELDEMQAWYAMPVDDTRDATN